MRRKSTARKYCAVENESKKTYTFTINRKNEKGDLIDEELDTSIKTGDSTVIIISVVAILALGISIFFMRKNKRI
ncbi:MAG: LPXTG cell wall anchor domain-containing protein [Bacilli bacterium]|nr:LPXTG cell wall anchor domain-containing protein [Bacilli bacterium]